MSPFSKPSKFILFFFFHCRISLLNADGQDEARRLITAELDESLCYRKQDANKLHAVRQKVRKQSTLCRSRRETDDTQMVVKFPILNRYVDAWPLDLIFLSLLKYRSSRGKEKDVKEAVALIKGHGKG